MTSKRVALLLFLGCFGFFGTFAHGYLENTDVDVTLQAARAWYLRGDPGLVHSQDRERLLGPEGETWAGESFVAAGIVAEQSFGRTGVNGKQYIWFPIGHQALLVPCVAAGEVLNRWFPDVEARSITRRRPIFGQFYWARVLTSFLSPFFAALSALALLLLASTLGASRREAVGIALVAVLCSQFWPGSSETMSNAPGAALLALAALGIARYEVGSRARRGLLFAGVAGGAAVFVRYPLALCLLPLCVWAVMVAKRRGQLIDIAWLVLGGLPFALALLMANYLRFGTVTETGYSSGASFGEFPMWMGFLAIVIAPGKGVLWFSPPIWFALAPYFKPGFWTLRSAAVITGFLSMWLLFSSVPYWAAGQCWGIRYLTAPLVLILVVVLARTKPWNTRWRIPFVATCLLGFVINLGGVLTPYIGFSALSYPAGIQIYQVPMDLVGNNVNFDVQLSPITGHWSYARESLSGGLDGVSLNAAAKSVLDVELSAPSGGLAIENYGFRHWWWRYLAIDNPGFSSWLALLLWLSGTSAALFFGLRAFLREEPIESSPSSSIELG